MPSFLTRNLIRARARLRFSPYFANTMAMAWEIQILCR